MTLQIHLDPYKHILTPVDLSKEFIRQKLSGSLIAEALELDPEATEIHIPNPQVTPLALECLVELSNGREPGKHNPELALAGHYLNIDVLLACADPLYDDFLHFPVHEVTVSATRQNRVSIFRYILQKNPNIDYSVYVEIAFAFAARDVAKLLLDTFPAFRGGAINAAVKCESYEILQLVVSYPDIELLDISYFSNLIRRGASNGLFLVLKTILDRGQEARLRSMRVSVIASESKYQPYIARPSHSLLLDIHLQAIKLNQLGCLAVIIQMVPLIGEEKQLMDQALEDQGWHLLYNTHRGPPI